MQRGTGKPQESSSHNQVLQDINSSLLHESEVFWTRDTRGTDSLRTALAIIWYCRTWAAAFTQSLRFFLDKGYKGH
jgi:hypothetical protein